MLSSISILRSILAVQWVTVISRIVFQKRNIPIFKHYPPSRNQYNYHACLPYAENVVRFLTALRIDSPGGLLECQARRNGAVVARRPPFDCRDWQPAIANSLMEANAFWTLEWLSCLLGCALLPQRSTFIMKMESALLAQLHASDFCILIDSRKISSKVRVVSGLEVLSICGCSVICNEFDNHPN